MISRLLALVVCLILAATSQAAKCRYEIEEADHLESRMLILYRGAITGMAGHFGVKQNQRYFQGRYGSNFKGRASFTAETPLVLNLDDGRTLTLEVMSEAISSKIRFGHVITVAREAKPVFTVTPDQWQALLTNPVSSLHMSFFVGDERHEVSRDVKPKHAQKIQAAMACVLPENAQQETLAPD